MTMINWSIESLKRKCIFYDLLRCTCALEQWKNKSTALNKKLPMRNRIAEKSIVLVKINCMSLLFMLSFGINGLNLCYSLFCISANLLIYGPQSFYKATRKMIELQGPG